MVPKIKISGETRRLAIIIAIPLIALFILYSVFKSNINKAQSLLFKAAEENKKLVLRKDITKLDNLIIQYYKYLYKTSEVYSLRDKISELAKNAGADILSLQTQEPQKIVNYNKVLFQIKLKSTYDQLGEFIAGLEGLDKMVKIEELSATLERNYDMSNMPNTALSEAEKPETMLSVTAYCPEK